MANFLPEQTQLQDAIHAPHRATRDRTIDALAAASTEDLRHQARSMAGCAQSVHLYVDEPTATVREYIHTCKARLCPLCGRRRSQHVADQMQPMVDAMSHPRHLVLTVKSAETPLREQITNLRRWFVKLRATPFWRANVTHGVYTVEATINVDTGQWHPHLHVIVDGNYLPHQKLRQLWHQVTGTADIVWISDAGNRQGLVRELCKYVGKPQNTSTWTLEQIRTYAASVKGTRMVQTFGTAPIPPVADAAPDDKPPPGTWSISVTRLVHMGLEGHPAAAALLPLVARRWPHLGSYIYHKAPQFAPDVPKAAKLLNAWKVIEQGPAPPAETSPAPPTDSQLEAAMVPLLVAIHMPEGPAGREADHLTEDME